MTTQQMEATTVTLPARSLRLTGEAGCPSWRGRLHLGAAVVSVPAGMLLFERRPSPAVAVYATGLVVLFAVSASYHLLPLAPLPRRRLRQADHVTIYVFTAASITPLCRYATGGTLGAVVAAIAWAGAGAGAWLKIRGFDRSHRAGGALYVVVGCVAVGTLPRSLQHLSPAQILLMAAMTVFYGAGAAVLWRRRPDPAPRVFGYHEVWHAAVVAASCCWYVVVWGLAGHPT